MPHLELLEVSGSTTPSHFRENRLLPHLRAYLFCYAQLEEFRVRHVPSVALLVTEPSRTAYSDIGSSHKDFSKHSAGSVHNICPRLMMGQVCLVSVPNKDSVFSEKGCGCLTGSVRG